MKNFLTTLRSRRHLILAGGLLALSACFGGLGNEALVGQTTLRGRIVGAVDVEQAWVAIEDRLEFSSRVKADGTFAIKDVPVGQVTLLASSGKGAALRRTMMVLDDNSAPWELQLGQGASLEGQVVLEGDDHARRAEFRLLDLPTRRVAFSDGRFVVDGLPETCFEVEATHPTHLTARAHICLQRGQPAFISLYLRTRDPEEEHHSPADAGHGDDDGGELEPPVPPSQLLPICAPCLAGSDCVSGLCAVDHGVPSDEKVCAAGCNDESDCATGFSCESMQGGRTGFACLPRQVSCAAIDNQDAPCVEDGDCGLGDGEMRCQAGQCLVLCGDSEDCTGGRSCVEVANETESFCL